MQYDPKSTLKEFNILMSDIRKAIPDQYSAFVNQKEVITKSARIEKKDQVVTTSNCKCYSKMPCFAYRVQ